MTASNNIFGVPKETQQRTACGQCNPPCSIPDQYLTASDGAAAYSLHWRPGIIPGHWMAKGETPDLTDYPLYQGRKTD